MRMKIWNRLLIALSGLVILFISAELFVFGVGLFPFMIDVNILNAPILLWQRIVIVASALLLVCLGVHNVWVLCHRRRDKGFVIQHTEFGDMSISLNALENMVKKCVDSHQMLNANATRIHRGHEGIAIDLKITLLSGVNIPLTVNALQKQIKQYITSCSGVDVQEIRVMVETNPVLLSQAKEEVSYEQAPVAPSADELQGIPSSSEETIYKTRQNFASRLFKHSEEPISHSKSEQLDELTPAETFFTQPAEVEVKETDEHFSPEIVTSTADAEGVDEIEPSAVEEKPLHKSEEVDY